MRHCRSSHTEQRACAATDLMSLPARVSSTSSMGIACAPEPISFSQCVYSLSPASKHSGA